MSLTLSDFDQQAQNISIPTSTYEILFNETVSKKFTLEQIEIEYLRLNNEMDPLNNALRVMTFSVNCDISMRKKILSEGIGCLIYLWQLLSFLEVLFDFNNRPFISKLD